ncbi:MAG: HEAT repeat domain-containing protein [Chlamydiota bacterium]
MGLSKIFFVKTLPIFFSFSALFSQEPFPQKEKNHILYLAQAHKLPQALEKYTNLLSQYSHDFELLQELAFILLQEGSKNSDPVIQQLTMFGAGLAASTLSLDILEIGLHNPSLQTQLTAIHFISALEDDRSQQLLIQAMKSDHLSARFEAAYLLATKKHPFALGHIESLMNLLPPFFKPYFPQLFSIIGSKESISLVVSFLYDPDPYVRVESIFSIVETGRDDLLPLIRKKLSHATPLEQEACLAAIRRFKDSASLDQVKKLSETSTENVRIAAWQTLLTLGDPKAKKALERLALKQNVFAIQALKDIPGSENVLVKLLSCPNIQVRINAILSLLHLKDPRCVPFLREIFITDVKDISIFPGGSMGKGLFGWKVHTSSSQMAAKDPNFDLSLALHIKEHFLHEALELPEKSFLTVANMIFEAEQNDLIPILVSLLENLKSEKAIALLKQKGSKAGAPLIRDYCNLSLFRLREEGDYEKYVFQWILNQKHTELIKLRPFVSWKMRQEDHYNLTPEETSRLLIEMYTAVALRKNEKGILGILKALQEGNPKNRYALAGLLLRATE